MECIEPGAVSADDLFAIACGQAILGATGHIARCAACSATVAAYSTLEQRLANSLFRVDCPPAIALGELALNILGHGDALALRAHLADCLHCGAELSMLVAGLRGDPIGDQIRSPNFFRRLVASLTPAAGISGELAGLRGAPAGVAREYKAQNVTISVIDQPTGQGAGRAWSLVGLIDTLDLESAQASIATAKLEERTVASAPIDALGNFSLDDLRSGIYTIELQFPDHVIVLDAVSIGDPPR